LLYGLFYYRHIATSDISGFSPRLLEVFVFLGCYAWPLLLESWSLCRYYSSNPIRPKRTAMTL